jgi:hypothetical protein
VQHKTVEILSVLLWGKFRKSAFISTPFPANTTDEAEGRWWTKYTFPGDISVVGCTRVHNLKPAPHGDEYVSRNGFSIENMQATRTYVSKEMLTGIHVSWPGSVHDSRIRKKTDVRVKLTNVDDVLLWLRTYGNQKE